MAIRHACPKITRASFGSCSIRSAQQATASLWRWRSQNASNSTLTVNSSSGTPRCLPASIMLSASAGSPSNKCP
uniref:hypothetical protein n=1 Tax=Pseudomonas serbiensis TaxID=3064350 RepID=UPI0038620D7D